MYGGHHRATLSLATSVDLDVEGGGRLDEDYDGGWSSSTSAWSAKGPAAYTSTMGVAQSIKCHLAWARIGIIDANRWPEAFQVATRSADIRFGIAKGFVLSASIALLIFIFELAFFPTHLFPSYASRNAKDSDDDFENVGSLGSVFWLYPLIAGSYFLASSWTVDVAKAAHNLKHGRMLSSAVASPAFPPGLSRRVLLESYRILLVLNYVVICVVLEQIPWIGRLLAFFFMSFIDAYYCFEQGWIARGWSVERRMRYAESRWAYFVAFGLPSTAISFFHPSGLLNLMLFMLIFPVCTVLAMLSNPQPRQAPTGSAALTPSNSGLSPGLANNKALSAFLPPRIPVFWLTVKMYRLLLRSFPRMLDASAASQATGMQATGNAAAWRNARQFANPALFGGGGGTSARGTADAYNLDGIVGKQQTTSAYGTEGDSAVPISGFGTGVDRGTGMGTMGKRGATAAQFVDGAWGGQGIGTASVGRPNAYTNGSSAANGNASMPSMYAQDPSLAAVTMPDAHYNNNNNSNGAATTPYNGTTTNAFSLHSAGSSPLPAFAGQPGRGSGKKKD